MKVRFDSLNRFEVPKFYVCNPGCTYDDGILSSTLGALSDTTDEELVLNFNTTSELNFRLNKIRREDPEENKYITKLYRAIQNRRLIFVEDVGFFVIRDVTDGFEDGIHYKDVRAESCEYEISQKGLPYIKDGTYKFEELLETVVRSLPLWKINDVNMDVANKWRTFEDVSVELNALSFLLENMQDAYECIFEFDTINRLINVYDQNYFVEQTNIHITKDDLIESIEITENSDDLYTAINVQGDENLNISPVNPLGGNVIYNFDYYLDWMSPALSDRVKSWKSLVQSKEAEYYELNRQYYNKLTDQSSSSADINMLNIQLEMYRRMRDNIVAESSTTTVESYNEIIVKNGGVPVGINGELSDTLVEIDALITDVLDKIRVAQNESGSTGASLESLSAQIDTIRNQVSILNYFTDDEYTELSNYIFEGNYTDEYIAVTESMTYDERFQKMKTLYDRAIDRLTRISEPTQEFSIDVENFLFVKEFAEWSDQLRTGCLINVELDTDDVAALFLSNITVNYDDKELSMTFGNRFNRFDPKAMFNNVLGNIKKSSNSIGYIKEILYPVKNGELSAMREAIESSQILTKNMALTSTNQEIIIDDTGMLGRRMLDNGEYDPKQVKLTNQSIVFTDDGWDTSKTGLGNFIFNNPFTGEAEEHYGVIADMLVGGMVLTESLGVCNSDNSLVMNENGFKLTADYRSNRDPNKPNTKTFEISKLITNSNGDELEQKQMYLDANGNLVLNGTLSVFTSSGNITNLEDITGGSGGADIDLDGIYGSIQGVKDSLTSDFMTSIESSKADTTSQLIEMSSSFNTKYNEIMESVDDKLDGYKEEIGRYMTFNSGGLTLGAAESPFKTIIDESGVYFKQGNTIVSYVDNNQLYIPNAVIENTLILGNFFFCPRPDGGVSITWQ
jgi:hypothetical protein